MATIIDQSGREHQAIVATRSFDVPDPLMGFDRQIVAGQPVPADLEEVYAKETGESIPGGDADKGGSGDAVDEAFASAAAQSAAEEAGLSADEIDEIDGTGADGKIKVSDVKDAV